jgi:hypothetical protein
MKQCKHCEAGAQNPDLRQDRWFSAKRRYRVHMVNKQVVPCLMEPQWKVVFHNVRLWWNGRHARLRALCPQGRESSSLFSRTKFLMDLGIQRFLCLILSPISFRPGGAHVWSDGRCILCEKIASVAELADATGLEPVG